MILELHLTPRGWGFWDGTRYVRLPDAAERDERAQATAAGELATGGFGTSTDRFLASRALAARVAEDNGIRFTERKATSTPRWLDPATLRWVARELEAERRMMARFGDGAALTAAERGEAKAIDALIAGVVRRLEARARRADRTASNPPAFKPRKETET